MTAATVFTRRPSLIDRLLDRWFAVPQGAEAPGDTEIREDLRTALEAASQCQLSALSAEYAHYLIDRAAARGRDRG